MYDFLVWLENTGFAIWIRESPSPFAYTLFLSAHAVGLAISVGLSTLIALRILGLGSQIPKPAMAAWFPLLWTAFWVNAVSGAVIFIPNAAKDGTSPIFFAKLLFIGIAAFLMIRIRRQVFPNAGTSGVGGRWLALAALTAWSFAIIAGRLVEYPQMLGFKG